MVETEWLLRANPRERLDRVEGKASDRKLRLFAVACCRHIWPLLFDERSRNGVEIMERYADDLATGEELSGGSLAAFGAYEEGMSDHRQGGGVAATAAYNTTRMAPVAHLDGTLLQFHSTRKGLIYVVKAVRNCGIENDLLASLLREIIGNPFRPITLASAHRTPTIVSLAQAAYDERRLPSGELDPHRLAVLADALEEIGAPDEMVAHLRGPGPHVRGCFSVDLCLGLS